MAGNFRGQTFNALMQPRAVYDRPLTFRGTIAPLGTYQNPDGTEDVGFAWPGIITEPLKALQRLHENSYTEDGRPSLMGSAVSSAVHDDASSGAVIDPSWLEDVLRRYY